MNEELKYAKRKDAIFGFMILLLFGNLRIINLPCGQKYNSVREDLTYKQKRLERKRKSEEGPPLYI